MTRDSFFSPMTMLQLGDSRSTYLLLMLFLLLLLLLLLLVPERLFPVPFACMKIVLLQTFCFEGRKDFPQQHTYTGTSTNTHTLGHPPTHIHWDIHQHTYTGTSTNTHTLGHPPTHIHWDIHQHTYTGTSTNTHTLGHPPTRLDRDIERKGH